MSLWKKLSVLLIALALPACQETQSGPVYNDIAVAAPSVKLNVKEIVFTDQYKPEFAPPHVENSFPKTPYDSARKIISQRLIAAGSEGTLYVTIRDASVLHTKAPNDPDTDLYNGKLEVDFSIQSADITAPQATFTSTITRNGSLGNAKHMTLNQRNDFFYDYVRGMMDDFSKELDNGLRQYFNPYVISWN